MTAAERRTEIKKTLAAAQTPITASVLAAKFSVSRQVIVGDIALLRTAGENISATPRGYIVVKTETGIVHQIVCRHADEDIIEELNAIVDHGCSVMNVIVDHPVYGELTGDLRISSRYDVGIFYQTLCKAAAPPLASLTGGIHIHTISCPDEEAFHRVEQVLKERGILISTIN